MRAPPGHFLLDCVVDFLDGVVGVVAGGFVGIVLPGPLEEGQRHAVADLSQGFGGFFANLFVGVIDHGVDESGDGLGAGVVVEFVGGFFPLFGIGEAKVFEVDAVLFIGGSHFGPTGADGEFLLADVVCDGLGGLLGGVADLKVIFRFDHAKEGFVGKGASNLAEACGGGFAYGRFGVIYKCVLESSHGGDVIIIGELTSGVLPLLCIASEKFVDEAFLPRKVRALGFMDENAWSIFDDDAVDIHAGNGISEDTDGSADVDGVMRPVGMQPNARAVMPGGAGAAVVSDNGGVMDDGGSMGHGGGI